ncbi:MAG: hypothetical protein AAB660_01550 [Patescibacteria group bacterium]
MFEAPEIPPENLKRRFSKELAPELRDETAQRIRKIRKLKTSGKELEGSELLEDYRAKEIYERLHESLFDRVFERQYLKELETKLAEVAGKKKEELIKEAQERFERELAKVLERSPLTPEEQEKYLSEEAMTEMNLENYLILLKRLSGNFVSHVTRQGVREKSFSSTSGYGSMGDGEFHNNFVEILKEKKLVSYLSGLESGNPHIDGYLKKSIEVLRMLNPQISNEKIVDDIWEGIERTELSAEGRPAAELSSVHFGFNEVLGKMYGAERGYDIYFYYPAEFVSKNYFHRSKARAPEEELQKTGNEREDYDNDVFVWNEGRGIPVNAGLVCIPENIEVDPVSGSQYVLDAKGKPVPNPRILEQMNFVRRNEKDVLLALKELRVIRNEKGWSFDPSEEFIKRLGFDSKKVFLEFFQEDGNLMYLDIETVELFFKKSYERAGEVFMRPESTVTSQEYWENVFKHNPGLRPSKVLYYRGRLPLEIKGRGKSQGTTNPDKVFHSSGDLPGHTEYINRIEQVVKNRLRHLLQTEEKAAA